jgi:hypothetical protein
MADGIVRKMRLSNKHKLGVPEEFMGCSNVAQIAVKFE